MKTTILLPVVIVAAVAALIFGYAKMSREKAADAEADQPISAASSVQQATNGATVITLDLKTQQLIGLQTASLPEMSLPPEMKAYGRVLDSAALVALHNAVAAARAALRASRPEYDRLKKLSGQDNASLRALEIAEAQMERDRSALATAEAQLMAASGKSVLDESPGFFQSLASQNDVLARLDLPAGELPAKSPVAARLTLPGNGPPVAADFLGRAATTDLREQGAGFLFLVTNAPPALSPGLALTGFLQLPGELLRGAVVPDAAVIRSDGRAWIYVQTAAATFARREISPDRFVAGGWFVTNNVAPGDKVVVTGAQTLLSEERKSQIKLED
jgi:hypothetical protein